MKPHLDKPEGCTWDAQGHRWGAQPGGLKGAPLSGMPGWDDACPVLTVILLEFRHESSPSLASALAWSLAELLEWK